MEQDSHGTEFSVRNACLTEMCDRAFLRVIYKEKENVREWIGFANWWVQILINPCMHEAPLSIRNF